MDAQVVRAEMREGFAGLHRRLDDLIGRVDQINGRVGKAHDRASRLEVAINKAEGTIAHIRAECARIWEALRRHKDVSPADGDGAHVTQRQLRLLISIVIATATMTAAIILWVLKMAGKL